MPLQSHQNFPGQMKTGSFAVKPQPTQVFHHSNEEFPPLQSVSHHNFPGQMKTGSFAEPQPTQVFHHRNEEFSPLQRVSHEDQFNIMLTLKGVIQELALLKQSRFPSGNIQLEEERNAPRQYQAKNFQSQGAQQ